ncbi:MAG: 8-oxo-dGTP pyrophosphatase MutT (NUDIX family) [Candidatus Poriferisodalaceae bacterium]
MRTLWRSALSKLPANAARRELHEETGLETTIIGTLGSWIDEYDLAAVRFDTLNT